MDRVTNRALLEVRPDPAGELVIVSATSSAERLLGAAHGTLDGSVWGPQLSDADAGVVLEECASVLERRRVAWTGAVQPASRAGRRVHITATRPAGSLSARLRIELTEAAAQTPAVGATSQSADADPDEHGFGRSLLERARSSVATGRADLAPDRFGTRLSSSRPHLTRSPATYGRCPYAAEA